MTAHRSVIEQMDGFFVHLSEEFICGVAELWGGPGLACPRWARVY
jgi:hypothetical protein